MPFSTDLNAHNFYSKPPLSQFNVDIIRQPHVRSIGMISTTLNWGVWGGGKLNYTSTTKMTYDRSCVSTILSKIVVPMRGVETDVNNSKYLQEHLQAIYKITIRIMLVMHQAQLINAHFEGILRLSYFCLHREIIAKFRSAKLKAIFEEFSFRIWEN